MKRMLVFLLISGCVGSTVSATNTFTGLWLGQVSVDAVSQANPIIPDLSFDLGVDGITSETELIAFGDGWHYNDTGTAPEQTNGVVLQWWDLAYDHRGWSSNTAEFGYGDTNPVQDTTISFGSDPVDKHLTTWFRQRFTVNNPEGFSSLHLRVQRDDGVAVYLNGSVILKDNLAPGPVTPGTPALAAIKGEEETRLVEVSLPAGPVLRGTNIIAVEVRQAAPDDPDLSFDLELKAVSSAAGSIMPVGSRWRYRVQTSEPADGFDVAAPSSNALAADCAYCHRLPRGDHR
ncbi:MAG: hypothetical protein AAF492_14130, partial [Verrucomicrobiota bacterium]